MTGNKCYKSEHALQADIVVWFWNTYPERRGTLWANFAEQNKIQASMKKPLGLVRALPDLMTVRDGKLIGIELKLPNTRHERTHLIEQATWLINNPYKGYFCDSFDMAKGILEGTGEGIDPQMILRYIQSSKNKSFLWGIWEKDLSL